MAAILVQESVTLYCAYYCIPSGKSEINDFFYFDKISVIYFFDSLRRLIALQKQVNKFFNALSYVKMCQ